MTTSHATRDLRSRLLAGLLALASLTGGVQAAGIPESEGPLVLGKLDWTGQEITMEVAGEILRRMGYTVEFVTTTNVPLFQAVADGEIHGYLEQWLVTTRHQFKEMVGKGQLEDLGLLGLVGQEGWFYPPYVESLCPGLPNWEALKNCAAIFATPETAPKGRVVDYPEEWTSETSKWIDAFGLDLVAVAAGGEGAIMAEVKSAVARNEPVLVFWVPTWGRPSTTSAWSSSPSGRRSARRIPPGVSARRRPLTAARRRRTSRSSCGRA
jgi:glycine betaine/proline transport system substrate-binding protein